MCEIRKFQVFGHRCSGTNALIKTLERNLPDLRFTEENGFKHWLVPPEQAIPDDTMTVVIAREVSQWLRSLHRKPWHVRPKLKSLAFPDFIRAPWDTVWDEDFWGVDQTDQRYGQPIAEERCPRTGRPFANAVAMRTAKLANWLAVCNRSVAALLVNHAVLVSDPRSIVLQCAELSGMSAASPFEPVTTYKGDSAKSFRPKRYPPLDSQDRSHVANFLDPELERAFGFDA